jgi:hypothetical protein
MHEALEKLLENAKLEIFAIEESWYNLPSSNSLDSPRRVIKNRRILEVHAREESANNNAEFFRKRYKNLKKLTWVQRAKKAIYHGVDYRKEWGVSVDVVKLNPSYDDFEFQNGSTYYLDKSRKLLLKMG